MKVRATLRIRNDAMIRARQQAGLSQSRLAEVVGCRTDRIGAFEKFDYTKADLAIAESIADFLGLSVDDIMPEGVQGKKVESTIERIAEVPTDRLLSSNIMSRYELPPADQDAERVDSLNQLREWIQYLTSRTRVALEGRYFRGQTLGEIGKAIGASKERVRQIQNRGVASLRWLATLDLPTRQLIIADGSVKKVLSEPDHDEALRKHLAETDS